MRTDADPLNTVQWLLSGGPYTIWSQLRLRQGGSSRNVSPARWWDHPFDMSILSLRTPRRRENRAGLLVDADRFLGLW